jgi:hypothetical protein
MNLVCFPNFTAGGLACDLLNNTINQFEGISLKKNLAHHLLKSGDNGKIFRTFNSAFWDKEIELFNKREHVYSEEAIGKDLVNFYVGTHCHPSCIPDNYFSQFNNVISITTERTESKLFRYIRMCYGLEQQNNLPEHNARLVVESFEQDSRCTNIEFNDIVNGKFVTDYNLNPNQYEQWKKLNNFLYSIDPVLNKIFNEVYLGEVNV